jgi:flagellar hook assembly protein FlgD
VYFDDMRSVSTATLSVSTEIIVRVGMQVLGIGDEPIPEVFALHQNYPNPFNPTTQIRYDLPEDANVNITIYDIIGRSIRSLVNSKQTAGYRSIRWDGKNNLGEGVSAGIYIYMIQAGKFKQTKKMVLLK